MVLNKLRACQLKKNGNASISDILHTVQHIAGISSSASHKFDQIGPISQFVSTRFLQKLIYESFSTN